MKKILLSVAGVLVLAVVGTLGYASTRPDDYHVERSITVAAAPVDVYPYVNDYTRWATWNPWGALDPDMKTKTSQNPVGVGAWTAWDGSNGVGSGKMTILDSVPNERVTHEIHFTAPMEDTAKATFSMKPTGEKTTFTWAMDGHMNLVGKTFGLFSSMDDMIGGQFDQGLATLKTEVEADAKKRVAAEQAAAQQAAEDAAAAAASVTGTPGTPTAPPTH